MNYKKQTLEMVEKREKAFEDDLRQCEKDLAKECAFYVSCALNETDDETIEETLEFIKQAIYDRKYILSEMEKLQETKKEISNRAIVHKDEYFEE